MLLFAEHRMDLALLLPFYNKTISHEIWSRLANLLRKAERFIVIDRIVSLLSAWKIGILDAILVNLTLQNAIDNYASESSKRIKASILKDGKELGGL
jgi:hypothetical protein